jgi:hypothetical protein
MFQEEENSPSVTMEKRLPGINKYSPIITLFVCTTLSLLSMKTGILSLFYLVPLGYVIVLTGVYMPVFITAAAANIVIMIVQAFSKIDGIKNMPPEALFLTAAFLGFAWIMGGKGLRTAYKFIIASSVCAVIFLIYINSPNSVFFELFSKTAEDLFGAGDSEIQIRNPLFTQVFTPELLTKFAKIFLLRGGALISMIFLFFINRQMTLAVVSMIKRQRMDHGLTAFYAPANTIWAFSASLATIVLTGIFKVEILSILAWNVFTVCAIIYLAQGIGILTYWMLLRSNIFRLIISVLIIVVLFSPLNTFAIAALVLLGIIDNWRPFRIAKSAM